MNMPEVNTWQEDDGIHIDVRGLAPPDPMVAIMQLLEQPDTGDVVVAYLDRDPVFIYPELAERGWMHETQTQTDGNVVLRLTRL